MKKLPALLSLALLPWLYISGKSIPASSPDDSYTQDTAVVDTIVEAEDTVVITGLNDIRFAGWEDKDWLDNDYIRALRQFLDEYAGGDPDIDPYKEILKSKFVVANFEPAIMGGGWLEIIFLDKPDVVFASWVYSDVDVDAGKVIGYRVQSLRKIGDLPGNTKEDILQVTSAHPELKLW